MKLASSAMMISGESSCPVDGARRQTRCLGVLGLCCTGFCLLGPAMIAILLPSVAGFGHGGWVMGMLSALSFGLIGSVLVLGYPHHHRLGPASLAGAAGVLTILGFAHVLPHLGIAASALLALAWGWDFALSRPVVAPRPGGREGSHGCH